MGIYFIAAGMSSKNRQKTLENHFTLAQLQSNDFIPEKDMSKLKNEFEDGEQIFAWGANDNSFKELRQVKSGEYVVDVKNKETVQVFKFCFWYKANDRRIQDYFGWDGNRPYKYVYFLKCPAKIIGRDKSYFQSAFSQGANQNWLVGQRYFDDKEVRDAMELENCNVIERFLGIETTEKVSIPDINTTKQAPAKVIIRENVSTKTAQINLHAGYKPEWLREYFNRLDQLKKLDKHYEREHESLVAYLFERLGYEPTKNIRMQLGRIDIRVDIDEVPFATIEVKKSWSLSSSDKNVVNQACNYAADVGTPCVIITNGDVFYIYDIRKGIKREEQLVSRFTMSAFSQDAESELMKISHDFVKEEWNIGV